MSEGFTFFYQGNITGDYRIHGSVYGTSNLSGVSCTGVIDYNTFKGSFFTGFMFAEHHRTTRIKNKVKGLGKFT